MIVVIPLGGIGKRFSDMGYTDPKPLIKVLGKEIIFYLIENLRIRKGDKLYIVYNKNLEKFSFERQLSKFIGINFLKLDRQTSGPVETIYKITRILEKNEKHNSLLILDADTFYKKNIIKMIDKKNHAIFYHKTKIKDPIFSYIKMRGKYVYKIAEKRKISSNANTGAYFFNSIEKFNQIAKKKIKINKKTYVSEVYEELIKEKNKINGIKLSEKDFACLGTPKQVIDFSLSNKVKKKRFCFDLDHTLVSHPLIKNDYRSVKPILENIKFLNYLYSKGHHIIIHTARRMRTHHGNIKKVKKDIQKLTIEQLKLFKINYNELIFGKPYANYYIDDLSVNPNENLNTKLGFYEKSDILTRSFNDVIVGDKFTIKYSKNLDKINNEANYLKIIPKKIKKFFPKVIEHRKNFYKMSTVKGLKLSYLLTNNLLTKDDLTALFNCLQTIHSSKVKNQDNQINIYENYANKLIKRIKLIKHYDLKKFNKLIYNLKNYEFQNKGKIGLIHGDPVLSNIIKNLDNTFKLLDPRGSLGNRFSIYGDVNYDLAKVYQSLTGYENIIYDIKIDSDYLKDLQRHFESLLIKSNVIDSIRTLKYLTASLYFSLISFHREKYQSKFLNIAYGLI